MPVMDISHGPFTVAVGGWTHPAADAAEAAALLHDVIAARTAEHPSRAVRWRIDGPLGVALCGQVALPEPDPGWLRWWIDAISAELRSCADPDGPVR
jgi:hypothetical protein